MQVDKKEKKKAYYRDGLKRKLNDKRNFLIESDLAVVIKADFPKSQYHFRVVAKEELGEITKLTGDQLPLLDHMMELANQIIEKQDHLESSNFRIGFKVSTFWNRLNLHVISDDFYSTHMKRPPHWNSFNTKLFMPFQLAHMMLSVHGSIEPLSEERSKELEVQRPFNCNQCDYVAYQLGHLKAHLFNHWNRKEDEREQKKKLDEITEMMEEATLDSAVKPAEPSKLPTQNQVVSKNSKFLNQNAKNPFKTQQQLQAERWRPVYVNGPLVNMMNLQSPNNTFK